MSEINIVDEMRDQAEWQETALDNPFMAKDMRRWADHMERLEAQEVEAKGLIFDLEVALRCATRSFEGASFTGPEFFPEDVVALIRRANLILNPRGDTL